MSLRNDRQYLILFTFFFFTNAQVPDRKLKFEVSLLCHAWNHRSTSPSIPQKLYRKKKNMMSIEFPF